MYSAVQNVAQRAVACAAERSQTRNAWRAPSSALSFTSYLGSYSDELLAIRCARLGTGRDLWRAVVCVLYAFEPPCVGGELAVELGSSLCKFMCMHAPAARSVRAVHAHGHPLLRRCALDLSRAPVRNFMLHD